MTDIFDMSHENDIILFYRCMMGRAAPSAVLKKLEIHKYVYKLY